MARLAALVPRPRLNLTRFQRVIASIEEPALIARIPGYVQQRMESDANLARAPPGHQEQTFNRM